MHIPLHADIPFSLSISHFSVSSCHIHLHLHIHNVEQSKITSWCNHHDLNPLNRIRGAGELLTYIRTLKMYGWESLFCDRLMERREMEVKHLSVSNIYFLSKFWLVAASYFDILKHFFLDTEIFGCVVCIFLGNHTYSFLFVYI